MDRLPPEILCKIFGFVDYSTLLKCSRVSKTWLKAIRYGDPSLTRTMYMNSNYDFQPHELAEFFGMIWPNMKILKYWGNPHPLLPLFYYNTGKLDRLEVNNWHYWDYEREVHKKYEDRIFCNKHDVFPDVMAKGMNCRMFYLDRNNDQNLKLENVVEMKWDLVTYCQLTVPRNEETDLILEQIGKELVNLEEVKISSFVWHNNQDIWVLERYIKSFLKHLVDRPKLRILRLDGVPIDGKLQSKAFPILPNIKELHVEYHDFPLNGQNWGEIFPNLSELHVGYCIELLEFVNLRSILDKYLSEFRKMTSLVMFCDVYEGIERHDFKRLLKIVNAKWPQNYSFKLKTSMRGTPNCSIIKHPGARAQLVPAEPQPKKKNIVQHFPGFKRVIKNGVKHRYAYPDSDEEFGSFGFFF